MSKEYVCIPGGTEFVSSDHENRRGSVLAVGDPQEWQNQGHTLPLGGITFISFGDVSEAILDFFQPKIIFSPVLGKVFDCIELALLLHNLGFAGSYRAMARDLPRPDVIEREVSQICPKLDFQIVMI